MKTDKEVQNDIAAKLQTKLLRRWLALLEEDELSPTDARTLSQFLRDNGWTLDLEEADGGMKDKLTRKIDPADIPAIRAVK